MNRRPAARTLQFTCALAGIWYGPSFRCLQRARRWPPSAQDLIDRRQRDEPRIEPSGVSLDQAVEMAQRRYRAKAVKAETVNSGGAACTRSAC